MLKLTDLDCAEISSDGIVGAVAVVDMGELEEGEVARGASEVVAGRAPPEGGRGTIVGDGGGAEFASVCSLGGELL